MANDKSTKHGNCSFSGPVIKLNTLGGEPMKYSLDKQAGVPAYMQIYNMLRQDITGGAIAPGGKLPSKRILAGELGVSVITVEHAYALLADEGYIQCRQRKSQQSCGNCCCKQLQSVDYCSRDADTFGV